MSDEKKVVLTHIDIPIMIMAEIIFKFIIASLIASIPFIVIFYFITWLFQLG